LSGERSCAGCGCVEWSALRAWLTQAQAVAASGSGRRRRGVKRAASQVQARRLPVPAAGIALDPSVCSTVGRYKFVLPITYLLSLFIDLNQ